VLVLHQHGDTSQAGGQAELQHFFASVCAQPHLRLLCTGLEAQLCSQRSCAEFCCKFQVHVNDR
jgi:hypothetical protein